MVLVNNKPTKVHHFLKPGEKITIKSNHVGETLASTANNKLAPTPEPKIIFENDDFLTLEKPVGLLVHPTEKGETDTLVNWLIKKYPKIKNVGEDKYREGIIHRLDRDVSGVMVVAKTQKVKEKLICQLAAIRKVNLLPTPEGERINSKIRIKLLKPNIKY